MTVTPATPSESKGLIPAKSDTRAPVDRVSSGGVPATGSALAADTAKTGDGTEEVVDTISKLDLGEKKDGAVKAKDAKSVTDSEDVKETCVHA